MKLPYKWYKIILTFLYLTFHGILDINVLKDLCRNEDLVIVLMYGDGLILSIPI